VRRSTSFSRPNAMQRADEHFLPTALGRENHPAPPVINTDKHAAYPPAIVELKADGVLEQKCTHYSSTHRPVQFLITSWNRITGPSNAGCVQASIFAPSGELAHDRPATKRFI
jgi:hypothetical protein